MGHGRRKGGLKPGPKKTILAGVQLFVPAVADFAITLSHIFERFINVRCPSHLPAPRQPGTAPSVFVHSEEHTGAAGAGSHVTVAMAWHR